MEQTKTTERLTPEEINGSSKAIQDIFRKVRTLILERAGKSVGFTDKLDGSPVTDTDIEVERILKAEMARLFPNLPVFGEESGYDDNDLPFACWLIDPIDGTKSFIEGFPGFTSMAVLIQNGEAIAGIIYNTSTDDMYTAQKGQGAYKNGERINLGEHSLVGVASCKDTFVEYLNPILEPKGVVCQKTTGGGGFGFTQVLDGSADARFNLHSGGYTHDYAPGALLLAEAGADIVPVLDDKYDFKTTSFVVCHPELGDILRSNIQLMRELEAMPKNKS